ncbi:MAG: hypothetical protein IPM80_20625 [Proteobacteria bacterium]|nr:hypothetical protein [Pseudomonadota bacterium]
MCTIWAKSRFTPCAAQAAKAHPEEDEEDGSISFTKEQQWKVDFAHAPVIERELRESVAATLRPVASREALVSSPAAGVLEGGASESFPYLGRFERGQVLMTLAGAASRKRCRPRDPGSRSAGVRARISSTHHAGRSTSRARALADAQAIAPSRAAEAEHEADIARTDLRRRRSGGWVFGLAGAGGGVLLRCAPLAGTVVEVRTAAARPWTRGRRAGISRISASCGCRRISRSRTWGASRKPVGAHFRGRRCRKRY